MKMMESKNDTTNILPFFQVNEKTPQITPQKLKKRKDKANVVETILNSSCLN